MDLINKIKSPEELLDYMNKNIKYGFIGKNGKKYTNILSEEWNDWYSQCIVQNGKEVLESNIGTCWDQVELERIWFENNHYIIHTFFIWFEVKKECEYPTHAFLIYEYNNKYYWFEHAFEVYRGIHKFTSLCEVIEFVKEKLIKYTKENYKNVDGDMNYLKVYEYTEPSRNLDVEGYLNHVTKNLYINKKS